MERPDLTIGFACASQITSPGRLSAKAMNTNIECETDNQDSRIRFVRIDSKTIRLALFCDAGLVSNPDLTSQLEDM